MLSILRVRTFAIGIILTATTVCAATVICAQEVVPWTPANQISPHVQVDVSFDSASGLYTYAYTIASGSGSSQNIWFFALKFDGTVVSSSSPEGWTFGQHSDRPIVSWAATEVGEVPSDIEDDGNVLPSPFAIPPGGTLSGFRIQSPEPPGSVTFYAQGETKIPTLTETNEELEDLDFTEDSVSGSTLGPMPVDDSQFFAGGRRPAVDTFLVFLNIRDDDVRSAPVAIVVKFGINGEAVDTNTFTATLNRVDVTAAFLPNGRPGELVALLDVDDSPLVVGRNVLLTSVQGTVPETTRKATDVDRLLFTIQ